MSIKTHLLSAAIAIVVAPVWVWIVLSAPTLLAGEPAPPVIEGKVVSIDGPDDSVTLTIEIQAPHRPTGVENVTLRPLFESRIARTHYPRRVLEGFLDADLDEPGFQPGTDVDCRVVKGVEEEKLVRVVLGRRTMPRAALAAKPVTQAPLLTVAQAMAQAPVASVEDADLWEGRVIEVMSCEQVHLDLVSPLGEHRQLWVRLAGVPKHEAGSGHGGCPRANHLRNLLAPNSLVRVPVGRHRESNSDKMPVLPIYLLKDTGDGREWDNVSVARHLQ